MPVDAQDLPDVALPETGGLECLIAVARAHGIDLSKKQLMHDFVLGDHAISSEQLVRCASGVGLDVRLLSPSWESLDRIKRALPAVVLLRSGVFLLLQSVDFEDSKLSVSLVDPSVSSSASLSLDESRFQEVWSGKLFVFKRKFEISDEAQPFGLGLIVGLIFREKRLVTDIVVAAVFLGLLALGPIMFWRLLIDKVLRYDAFSTFTFLCIGMIILVVFETAFAWLRRRLLLRITTRVDIKLSVYMMEKVLNLPMDYFETYPLGDTLYRIGQMPRIRKFLTGQLFGAILDSTVLLFFVPLMFYFSVLLTSIVLVICSIIAAWIILMLPAYSRRSHAVDRAESTRGAFLSQTIAGIRTVKSLALESAQRKKYDLLTARVARLRIHEGDFANIISTVVHPLERLVVSGSVAVGVYIAITTRDPVYTGALFGFLILSQRIAAPLIQMAQLVQQYEEARGAIEVVASLVNIPEEEGRSLNGVKKPLAGHVEFTKLQFKYKGALVPALQDLSFEIPAGTTLGVMGRSGSGKTTITRLLQRLHSDYMGVIKIDGIDIREYDLDHLRSSLGVVLQENFLFSGTIRENICAAKIDATYDEMVYAARLAGAEEFIDKLPRGYETYIYEGSPNLSGGQRQRLAIARALITDPKLLILDEATSALDAESEAIVNANLRRIAAGRTMFVISHRLSSLVHSDAIMVLERGKIHDIGRHQELLERCDIYSGLWYQQNSRDEAPNSALSLPGSKGLHVA